MLGLAPEPFPIRCRCGVWVAASANETAVAALELDQSPGGIDISRGRDPTKSHRHLEILCTEWVSDAFDSYRLSPYIVQSILVITVAKYGLEHILTRPLAFQGFIPARVDHYLVRGWRLTSDLPPFSRGTARGRV